jgi:hypothetical protein
VWSERAAAKIQCKGNFQVAEQALIATPYCEEEQIARVARQLRLARDRIASS